MACHVKYDVYVAPKSEYATDEVLKVSIEGDAQHIRLAAVEIAMHLRKIYSDEFEIISIKEIRIGSTTRENVNLLKGFIDET